MGSIGKNVTTHLDSVIRLVNTHGQDIQQTQQALDDTNQTVEEIRQAVESSMTITVNHKSNRWTTSNHNER